MPAGGPAAGVGISPRPTSCPAVPSATSVINHFRILIRYDTHFRGAKKLERAGCGWQSPPGR